MTDEAKQPDTREEVDNLIADARTLVQWCQEDYFTDSPECSDGVKALQDAADNLSARIRHLRPTAQEQSDLDLDDAETTALIERAGDPVPPLEDLDPPEWKRPVIRTPDSLKSGQLPADSGSELRAKSENELSPEDSDPEVPEDYDPGDDLGVIGNAIGDYPACSKGQAAAFARLQLYILHVRRTADNLHGLIRALATAAEQPTDPAEQPADRPTVCKQCGSVDFVCRENVPQEWPMASNKGGVSIEFETGGGSTLDYDSCHGAAVYCAKCGREEPDVGIDFVGD